MVSDYENNNPQLPFACTQALLDEDIELELLERAKRDGKTMKIQMKLLYFSGFSNNSFLVSSNKFTLPYLFKSKTFADTNRSTPSLGRHNHLPID